MSNGNGESQVDAAQAGLTDFDSPFNQHHFQIRQALARISTMRLVKIMKVHLPKQQDGSEGQSGQIDVPGTVDVLPLVNQTDGLGKATKHVTVYGLPYFRHQSGGNATIMDPVEGDIGLCHIADRDCSGVIANKDQAPPGSSRRFDLSDGMYVGGVLNKKPQQYRTYTADSFTDNAVNNANKTSKNISDTATGGNITHLAQADDNGGGQINHTAKAKNNKGGTITHNADTSHTINSKQHTVNAQTNITQNTQISPLLKLQSVSQITNMISGGSGGSAGLGAIKNLISGHSLEREQAPAERVALASFTLTMPTVDAGGNPLSDGLSCSVSFGDSVGTLSWVGTFNLPPPTTASQGQVMKFIWSASTASWWND